MGACRTTVVVIIPHTDNSLYIDCIGNTVLERWQTSKRKGSKAKVSISKGTRQYSQSDILLERTTKSPKRARYREIERRKK